MEKTYKGWQEWTHPGEQREYTEETPLLADDGTVLAAGWARRCVFQYDRSLVKHKMRRKARRFRRLMTRGKKPLGAEEAIRRYIAVFNIKFYDNRRDNELTWARWFFPIITTSKTLSELDRYMVECIRFIRTGKHTKGNYRLRYDTIKSYGFRSLVHEYYRGLKAPGEEGQQAAFDSEELPCEAELPEECVD